MYTAADRNDVSRIARVSSGVFLAVLVAACGVAEDPGQVEAKPVAELPAADLVLRGGAIYTVNPQQPWAEALAVDEGRIVFVGGNEDVTDYIDSGTRVLDLDGRMVMPGMQDAHVHPISGGVEALSCDLNAASTLDEYIAIVQACAAANPGESWVQGGGWSMSVFGPGALAAKELLDAVVPDRPVYLSSADGHTAWVNSRALEIAGITADTPDPADGRIDREANGEPVGSLQEGATYLVSRHLPPLTPEGRMDGLRYAIKMLNGYGITALQSANVGEADLAAYAQLQAQGELTIRAVTAQWWERDRGLEQVAEMVDRRARYTGGKLNAGSVKIMQDGVMENYTAAMLEPYLLEGSPSGIPMIEPEALKTIVSALDAEGFQVHFHAIGDAAIRQSLDAVAQARADNGAEGGRHHISHLQLINAADIPRFSELGVAANFQPLWAYPDAYITDLTLPYIGAERGKWLYPINSTLQSGAVVAFGSDWSVSTANPFTQMEVAVTRADPSGQVSWQLNPEQAITLAQAIEAFTLGSAWVNGLELETGSIEVGKYADLAVLDRNLFKINIQELSETQVVLTLLEGVAVYDALMNGNP